MAELVKPPISIIVKPDIIEEIKEEVKSEPVDSLGVDGTEDNIWKTTEEEAVPAESFNFQGKALTNKHRLFTSL